MLLSTFAIQNLSFGTVFPQKYPSKCHIHHMKMAQYHPCNITAKSYQMYIEFSQAITWQDNSTCELVF